MVVEIRLLGGFEVRVDGTLVPEVAWRRRGAASLVKVLALARGGTLHREQVIDLLWPDLGVDEAAPRLHKAAHYARKAIGEGSMVLRGDVVALVGAGATATVDVHAFLEGAEAAQGAGTADAADRALRAWTGPLLPADPYEPWAEAMRERVADVHQRLLRHAGRWEELLAADPTDEEAALAAMHDLAAAGDHRGALRQFERLDRALRSELGVGPGAATLALRDDLLARGPAPVAVRPTDALHGREHELRQLQQVLADASCGAARAAFVGGPAGIGKTALLDAATRRAADAGWLVGRGAASAIEGAWPYAPVLEALAELSRAHPEALEELPGALRIELERAMAGEDLRWSGDAQHRRLFVAAGELTALATTAGNVLLVIDDVHEADDASLRLVHHLVRASARRPLAVLLGHRTPAPDRLDAVRTSLVGRGVGVDVPVGPLDRASIGAMLAERGDGAAPDDDVWDLSGGVPWLALELARQGPRVAELPGPLRDVLQRVAVAGVAFDTDVFVALSGLTEDEAFDQLDAALASGVVEADASGYRFGHRLVRQALLAGLPVHRRRQVHRDTAARLASVGGSSAQIGHHLLEAGDAAGAVPHLLRAADVEAAMGAHREALALIERARSAARGDERARLLALRAELLAATGDPGAIQAYREAIELADDGARRVLRAGMAKVAVWGGDLDTARAALDGLELDGGPADLPILLARGHLAYLSGDVEAATATTDVARAKIAGGDVSWHLLSLVSLQGLLAHHRGDWFERIRLELRRTKDEPDLAKAVFDGHLCAAEFLLYGPTPYDEVLDLALGLKESAVRSGARRAEAFAMALAGETALLAGDLATAGPYLREAVDLHHEAGSAAGEALCLQRLAEVHLAQGDREGAEALLRPALRLARWSPLAVHLVQRVYGTLITAAPDPVSARAVVDRAMAETGGDDRCRSCQVMLEVPAAIACADVGDLDEARTFVAAAERTAERWPGTAWQAAVLEAKAHVAAAEGDGVAAAGLLAQAAASFAVAGQPLDAARCRRSA